MIILSELLSLGVWSMGCGCGGCWIEVEVRSCVVHGIYSASVNVSVGGVYMRPVSYTTAG